MATLHLLSSPKALRDCLKAISSDDTLLLLQDGIYAAAEIRLNIKCVALSLDISARGLTGQVPDYIQPIDDMQFVKLVTEHTQSISWQE